MLNNSSHTRKIKTKYLIKTHFKPLNSIIFFSIFAPESSANEFYSDFTSPNSGPLKVMPFFAFHCNS